MRLVNLLFVFVLAPFIGLGIAFVDFELKAQDMSLPFKGLNASVETIEKDSKYLWQNVTILNRSAVEQDRNYKDQNRVLGNLAAKSQSQKEMSDQIYEDRILSMLGPPIGIHRSARVEIKVFKLDELGYRGYIAKLKLFDPSAFNVLLAAGGLGRRETTERAVARTGAVLGINGGGFYTAVSNGVQQAYPIGNTVIEGKFVGGFNPSSEVFFSGISKSGKFIGGTFTDYAALANLEPWQGVSFLPVLIKGGKPLKVPGEWATTKQPRTIIGEYANGDLIMIVVDGRQSDWSSGVTLERLQDKLAELGVKEGYNLDGGGSSTFIFKGQVLNRPSDGEHRPVVTNIIIRP